MTFCEDLNAIQNIENYQNLKKFLGNKRKSIEKDDYSQNAEYFKKDINEKNKEILSVDQTQKGNFILENDLNEKITIFKKPIILIEIFNNQTINIDFINDNLYYWDKFNQLNKFNYKVFSLNKDNTKLNVSDILSLPNNTVKDIKIQNENFIAYLLVMKSKFPEIKDDDILFENIYPNKQEEKTDLISPNNISKIFFVRIGQELSTIGR